MVGSHAHVLQPLGSVGGAPVAYGMGNFVFYGTSAAAVRSGVLQVSVRAVPGSGAPGRPAATDHLAAGDDRGRAAGRRRAHGGERAAVAGRLLTEPARARAVAATSRHPARGE